MLSKKNDSPKTKTLYVTKRLNGVRIKISIPTDLATNYLRLMINVTEKANQIEDCHQFHTITHCCLYQALTL